MSVLDLVAGPFLVHHLAAAWLFGLAAGCVLTALTLDVRERLR